MKNIGLEDVCQYKHIDKLKGATRDKMLEASSELHRRLNDALEEGYNPNLCKLARYLKENKFTEAESVEVIYQNGGHRAPQDGEIERAAATVYESSGKAKKVKWRQPDEVSSEALQANLARRDITSMSEAELMESIGTTPACDDVTDFLKRYFKGVDLVYVGDLYTGEIAHVDDWIKSAHKIKKEGYNQLVCNPMKRIPTAEELEAKAYDDDGKPVLTKSGRHKFKYGNKGRCYEFASNTLDVVTYENDTVAPDVQFAVISYIAKYLPLIAIVDSANKSFHATFSLKGVPKKDIPELRQTLVNLGADRAVVNPIHLTRLGCVQREGKGLQRVLYLNEDARSQSVEKKQLNALFDTPPHTHQFEEVHRRAKDGKYFMQNTHTENWHVVSMQEMKEDLVAAGLSKRQVQEAIAKGRHEGSVSGVLQLAARSRGMFETRSGNILVPNEKFQTEPKEGEWPVTEALFKGMFYGRDYNMEQYDVWMSWLARAWHCYKNEEIKQAQFLHIAGDAGSYKTYLFEHVLSNLFGPIVELNKHLVQDQQFNSDLFEKFLQVADDPSLPNGGKVNHELIKNIAVSSGSCRCEGKNLNAVTIPALRRGILLTNTGTEAMRVVPALEDGMDDKIICLYVHKFRLDVPGVNLSTEKALLAAWKKEAPALAYVLENYAPPAWDNANYADRYGVPSYKNPLVLKALRELSPAEVHYETIRKVVWRDYDTNKVELKTYTAKQLLALGNAAFADGVVDFFGWESARALGKAIAELAQLSPDINGGAVGKNTAKWHFTRPDVSPLIDPDDAEDEDPF